MHPKTMFDFQKALRKKKNDKKNDFFIFSFVIKNMNES